MSTWRDGNGAWVAGGSIPVQDVPMTDGALLVARLHIDLQRVSSAACPACS